jgi:hypothetical protein
MTGRRAAIGSPRSIGVTLRMYVAAATVSARIAVPIVVLLLAQTAAAVAAVGDRPSAAIGPVVLAGVAVVLGMLRLRERVPGPDIHDRQLDMIIAWGAAAVAGALVVAQLSGAGSDLGLLAPAAAAVAVLAVRVGSWRSSAPGSGSCRRTSTG